MIAMKFLYEEMERCAKAHRVPVIAPRGKEILTAVTARKRPRSVLEIGTAIGYSTLLIAEHAADDVRITTLELDAARAETARRFIAKSRFADRVRVLQGDAAARMKALDDAYDLIFIDAAKGQYVNYFQLALPLLTEGGVIIADNVLFRGMVRGDAKVPRRYKTIVTRLREYIEMVTRHPDFVTEIHEDGDGLAVSYHRRKAIEET